MKKKHYSDFLKSGENISTNILADRLEKLETNGIISKTIDKNNRTKNIYTLTQKGADLLPLLIESIIWGTKYNNHKISEEYRKTLNEDKATLIKEILSKIEIVK